MCYIFCNAYTKWHIGFYRYYQIYTGDDDPQPKSGSTDQKELTSVGLNSLWGMIYMIREKLHMSHYELMWKRSWINIEMMLADQPRVVSIKKKPTVVSGKFLAERKKARKQNG